MTNPRKTDFKSSLIEAMNDYPVTAVIIATVLTAYVAYLWFAYIAYSLFSDDAYSSEPILSAELEGALTCETAPNMTSTLAQIGAGALAMLYPSNRNVLFFGANNETEPVEDSFFKKYGTEPKCPDPKTKFLIATPFAHGNTGLRSVADAVDRVYFAASNKYGKDKVMKLIDEKDTLQNFGDYLTCPSLDGIFSLSSHIGEGRSFYLWGNDTFSYTFFQQPYNFNYSNTIIAFNTCYAYNNATPGFCSAIHRLSPKIYSGGVTPLPISGSPETYACFFEEVLRDNTEPNKALLTYCAQENDPVSENSQAPLYLKSGHNDADDYLPFTVTTTSNTYNVSAADQLIRLKLNVDEAVNKVDLIFNGTAIACETDKPGLFDRPGLKAMTFVLSYQSWNRQCIAVPFSAETDKSAFPNGHDAYGISPHDACGEGDDEEERSAFTL